MTLLREADEGVNRLMDFHENPVRSVHIVGGNELPNFFKVCERGRVKDKTAHERRRSSLLVRSRLKASSPSMGLTRPLLISS